MIVGIYQFAPVWGGVENNLQRISQIVKGNHADLWVFPELATTGYLFSSQEELAQYAEQIPEGRVSERLMELSYTFSNTIVIGMAEKKESSLYNSAAVFSKGRWLGTYRKIHLFNKEKAVFARGTEPPLALEVDGYKLGVMICFDWVFPEVARTLALAGVDVIAHPANLVLPYCQAAMVTRSLENRVFTITCNRIGEEEKYGEVLRFTGGSQIVSPQGEIIKRLATDKEEVAIIEIQALLARDKTFGQGNDLFKDRYPRAYRL